jgi:hypothetical protein
MPVVPGTTSVGARAGALAHLVADRRSTIAYRGHARIGAKQGYDAKNAMELHY